MARKRKRRHLYPVCSSFQLRYDAANLIKASSRLSPYAWTITKNLVASPEAACRVAKACAGLQAGKLSGF